MFNITRKRCEWGAKRTPTLGNGAWVAAKPDGSGHRPRWAKRAVMANVTFGQGTEAGAGFLPVLTGVSTTRKKY